MLWTRDNREKRTVHHSDRDAGADGDGDDDDDDGDGDGEDDDSNTSINDSTKNLDAGAATTSSGRRTDRGWRR